MEVKEMTRRLSGPGFKVVESSVHAEGFVAITLTEVEAYRMAHAWKHAKVSVEIRGSEWSVRIEHEPGTFAAAIHRASFEALNP